MELKNLKFRAYDKELKCETKFKIYYNQVLFFDRNSNFWKYDDNEERFVLTQFTGYHDKDGKEIYLGDIVEADNYGKKEYGEVKWGVFSFSSCDEYPCGRKGLYIDIPCVVDGEVIGRIPLEYVNESVKVIGNVAENKKDVLSVIKKGLNNGN